jgi:hypothetical protein
MLGPMIDRGRGGGCVQGKDDTRSSLLFATIVTMDRAGEDDALTDSLFLSVGVGAGSCAGWVQAGSQDRKTQDASSMRAETIIYFWMTKEPAIEPLNLSARLTLSASRQPTKY